MKKQLLLTAMAVGFTLSAFSQTKGTNALSFGVTTATNKATGNSYENKAQTNAFTLGYGHFFNDNRKIGLELTYGEDKYSFNNTQEQKQKNYGGNLSYQHYFPLVKTLYAYAGGKGSYTYSKSESEVQNAYPQNAKSTGNRYTLGAYGGITWFVSKRFALETNLLAADIVYSKTQQRESNIYGNFNKTENTSFNLTSQGFINNLGFKIYILF